MTAASSMDNEDGGGFAGRVWPEYRLAPSAVLAWDLSTRPVMPLHAAGRRP
jgi:hypothetical protein